MTSGAVATGTACSWNSNPIAELTSINGVEITADFVEMSNHDSSDDFREWLPTMFSVSDVVVEGNWKSSDTAQVAIHTDMLAKTSRTVVITAPNSSWTWTCTCYVANLKISSDAIDGKQEFTATFKTSGKPTLGISASTDADPIVLTGNVGGAMTQFHAGGSGYSASVYDYGAEGAGDATFTVTVTAGAAESIVLTHGSNTYSLTSATPSSALALTAGGLETITIKVTDSGKVPITYTYRVMDS
ncbi:MAG: hypothetical protein GY833_06160 [Aestuariibacter sp.]|nr:hypothetical protein [Aestuariibacter sp.]